MSGGCRVMDLGCVRRMSCDVEAEDADCDGLEEAEDADLI